MHRETLRLMSTPPKSNMMISLFILPNRLYQSHRHKAAGDKFENGTKEDTYETTPACFEGLVELFTGDEFAENSTYERTKDDTYCAKEKSDKDTYRTTPHSPFCASIVLRTPRRNDIVENGDHDGNNAPYEQELPTEIDTVGGLRDPYACIGNRCTRQTRHDTAYNADQDKEKCYD